MNYVHSSPSSPSSPRLPRLPLLLQSVPLHTSVPPHRSEVRCSSVYFSIWRTTQTASSAAATAATAVTAVTAVTATGVRITPLSAQEDRRRMRTPHKGWRTLSRSLHRPRLGGLVGWVGWPTSPHRVNTVLPLAFIHNTNLCFFLGLDMYFTKLVLEKTLPLLRRGERGRHLWSTPVILRPVAARGHALLREYIRSP